MERKPIIMALAKYINQRSWLDTRNYSADKRAIAMQGRDARAMLRAVALSNISAEDLAAVLSPSGRSGRLTYIDGFGCNYCAKQYFATEYRVAVCRALAQVLSKHYGEGKGKQMLADWAKRNLGRAIASRWFV